MSSIESREQTGGRVDPPSPRIAAHGPIRACLLGAGALFVALAALGILLPVLPTTPFLLLAGACFARNSERADRWLRENRVFGPYVKSWRNSRALPPGARPRAIAVVLLTFAISIIFAVHTLGLRLLLGAIGLALLVFLARLPVLSSASTRAGCSTSTRAGS